LLTVNSKNTPIFALDQTDYLIGLEKLEALRFLYASKAKPTVLLGDKYEIRNTVYFQMEYFAPEDDIDKEIYALADRLYKFNSVEYEKTLQFKIKSTNIAIFGMLSQFHELGLTEKIIKKVVRQQFKKNPMAQSYNLQALKEGKAWFQAVKVPNS
jgi:Pyruvate/2-oxoacid:ferredoxin oxidoreductase gamma subunit